MIAGGADTLATLLCLLLSSSTVILADFLKTALEFIAVLLSWLAIRRIRRGSKHAYDYGLDKLENLSSLFIGFLMVICLAVIVLSAVHHLSRPSHIRGLGVTLSMFSQVVYAAINARLCLKSRRAALLEFSPIMDAQARLFMIKAAANVFILAALLTSSLFTGYSWTMAVDPLASLIIAASILLAALGIFRSSCRDLLDRTLEESHQMAILKELTLRYDDYHALHGIRSRRAGSRVFIEIFLEFAPDKPAAEVHALAEKLRKAIEEKIFHCRASICLAVRPEE
jgi:cation diffusion facilitator family transporter